MRSFRRILCPIDFSAFSEPTVRLAGRLAGDFDATLHVLYVLDTRAFSPAETVHDPAVAAANRERVERSMADFLSRLDLRPEQGEIVEGVAHRAIVKAVQDGEFDLVAMGTHGLSGFERFLLGSVTEKVLHKIDVPLLAVPHPDESAAARVDEPAFLRTLILATDLGPGWEATLEPALALARRYGAETLLAHAVAPPLVLFGPPEAPWLGTGEMEEAYERLKVEREKRLRELARQPVHADARMTPVLLEGEPAEALVSLARERDADLILAGAHGLGRSALGWVGSTCHRLLRSAPCPVFAVRHGAAGGD